MEGKMTISSVRLETAENGLVLRWSEEYHHENNSRCFYESREKVYKTGEEAAAIQDLIAKGKENEYSHKNMKY